MPQRPELNSRFKSYRKSELLKRHLVAGILSTCLLAMAGLGVTKVSPTFFAGAATTIANTAGAAGTDVLSFVYKLRHPDIFATPQMPPVSSGRQRESPSHTPEAPSTAAPPEQLSELPSSTPIAITHSYPGKVLGASATTITLPQPGQIPNDLVRSY